MTTAPTTTVHGLTLAQAGVIHLHRDRIRLRGVCIDGEHVGSIVEVLLDSDARRVAGFAVRLAGGEPRFVPLAAVAALGPCGIELSSELHLMRDVRFYEDTGVPLSALLGRPVGCRHLQRSPIADVIADLGAGEIVAVELTDGRTLVREALAPVADGFRVACTCDERRS